MIGQQKRPLEHTVSSQPVKYQRHSDDKSCDAHTRVPSLTDEQHEFQHFSGASQKNSFSVSPGNSCDSIKVFERALTSELCSPLKVKGTLEPKNGACWGSQDSSIRSEEYEAIRTTDGRFAQSAKESTIVDPKVDTRNSFEKAIKIQGSDTPRKAELLGLHWMRDTGDPSSSGSGASLNGKKRRNSRGCLGTTSREPSLPILGDEQTDLHQGATRPRKPSTGENNVEADTFPEIVHTTVDAQLTTSSQPLPVLMSEKVVDLYVMDERVQSWGGYDAVTSGGLWGNISEALGLGLDCGPGLKLIYFKYLRGLKKDRKLLLEGEHDYGLMDSVNMRGAVFPNEKRLIDGKGERSCLKIGEQFAESEPFHEKSGEKSMNGNSSYVRSDDHQEADHSEDETETGSIKSERELEQCREDRDQDDHSFLGNCNFSQECRDIPVAVFPECRLWKGHIDSHCTALVQQGRELRNHVEEQGIPDKATLERENKSLANTLMWVKRMALDPGNPDMGQGPEGTGQNETWATECASRALKVRALLWKRRDDVRPGDGHLHQLKQILAPSHYYEELPPQEQQVVGLRATRERVAHYGSASAQKPLLESSNLQRGSVSSLNQPQWVGQASHRLPRQSHFHNEERYCEELLDRPRKRIPVGADFQAHIPVCKAFDHSHSVADCARAGPTGDETQSSDEDDEYDSRWLGKQVWPPPGGKRFAYKDRLVSRGIFCSCLDPESLNCVQQHILEERDCLKQELGQAFYIWKFDQMGESVADYWTKDEERTFRALVKMNPPSQDKNFWDQLPETFPGKSMKELVSYYFNVFVLRRRAIQNRLDTKHEDSDDDETDLPEGGSEDSEDYESGDEVDEEADEDSSEEEDESCNEEGPYGVDTSAKLLEDAGFCDLGGVNLVYSSKMGVVSTQHESEGVPVTLCTAPLMGLEDVHHGYHNPHPEEREVRLLSARMPTKWSHEHHDDEKHLEEHMSIVGEEELQEVKTWEASHWDDADHEDLAHDPVAKDMSCKSEVLANCQTQCTQGDPSVYKKVIDGSNQHNSLGPSEGEVWETTIDIAPIKERDKLLSTNGMIQEFFGNEASGLNASG